MVWFCFSLSSRCGLHRVGSCSIARAGAEAEWSMGSVQAQGSPPQHQYLDAKAAHCWDTSTLAVVSTPKQSPSWMIIPNRPHSGTEARAHFLAEAARTRPSESIRPSASNHHYTCGGLWPKWVGPDRRKWQDSGKLFILASETIRQKRRRRVTSCNGGQQQGGHRTNIWLITKDSNVC